MIDEVQLWIQKENLIQKGDHVVAGVSGGADSICMLLLLLELREKQDFALEVLHVEHGIRGEESREDARFVETFCRERQIDCRVCHVDVPQFAKEQGIGMEEAARLLRHDCYRRRAEQLAAELGEDAVIRVALAHHADDNAETVLFRMIRGSGIRGLCGMRAKRRLCEHADIIRPLLLVTRCGIEEYLQEKGQAFREDATNADTDYSRNRLRHNVMPELERIHGRANIHISESARELGEIAEYLEGQVWQLMSEMCRREEWGYLIKADLFEGQPAVLVRELVLKVLELAAGSRKDIGSVHVKSVLELAELQVGRSIMLPYRLKAERVYEGIRVRREHEEAPKEKSPVQYEISMEMLRCAERGEVVTVAVPDGEISLRIWECKGKLPEISKKKYTKWFDYGRIKDSLQIRTRLAGDYLIIDETGHRKKLKEYFIDEKIPGEQRSDVWLVAERSHVLWVVGRRMGADCRICGDTEKILEIRFAGGSYVED
ncbi:MAG: tRNA lysidine(34) synthetase TilS [Roseburia sp.]|nr:tRNA lysidine(34) synthetase TilS [Roseburia sp.]